MLLSSSNQEQSHRNIKNGTEMVAKDVLAFQKKLSLQNWVKVQNRKTIFLLSKSMCLYSETTFTADTNQS